MIFRTYYLGEILDIRYGKSQKNVESPNGSVPILGTGGIIGYADKFLYDKPSVLIGRKGTINKVRYIEEPFWTIDTLFYTIINENIVHPHYLYYLLSTIDFSYYNEGTTIPSLRAETLKLIQIELPDIEEQKKVLEILKSIDDKIAINNKLNDNLEEQIRLLFNKYHDSADNQTVLSECCTLTSSKRVFAKDYVKEGVPFYRGKEITMKRKGESITDILYISEENYDEIKDKYGVPNIGDVLLTAVGTLGNSYMVQEEKFYFKDGNIIWLKDFRSNEENYYIYDYMQSSLFSHDIDSIRIGSTQSALTIASLGKLKVLLPNESKLKEYYKTSKTIRDRINANIKEAESLSELRDTLLPKLMSGEIDLIDVELEY